MKIDKHIYIYIYIKIEPFSSSGFIYEPNFNRKIKEFMGDTITYLNESNLISRDSGPAIIRGDGDEEWYINDKLNRLDGPAVTSIDGYKEYWVNDQLHNENGPAIVYPNGVSLFFLYNVKYTEEEYYKKLNKLKRRRIKNDTRKHKSD